MDNKIKFGLISSAIVFYYFYKHKDDEYDENKMVHHAEQTIATTDKFGKCNLSVTDPTGKTTNQTIPMCNDGYTMSAGGKKIITCPGSGNYTIDNINYQYNCSYSPGITEFTKSYTTTEKNYKYPWIHDWFK
jgi:hypothetical protein